jgi:hypothetical protein
VVELPPLELLLLELDEPVPPEESASPLELLLLARPLLPEEPPVEELLPVLPALDPPQAAQHAARIAARHR